MRELFSALKEYITLKCVPSGKNEEAGEGFSI